MREDRNIFPKPPLDEIDEVVSRLGSLAPSSPVRRAALAVMQGEPPETIQPLIAALLDPSPKRWQEREIAAWTLGRAPLHAQDRDAAVGTLLDVLEESVCEGPWQFWKRVAGRAALPTLLLILFMRMASGGPSAEDGFLAVLFTLYCMMMAVTAVIGWNNESTNAYRVRAAAATALGNLRAPESGGALAGVLFHRDPGLRTAAALALHQVLPALTDDHYGQVGAQSVANLGRALNHSDNQLVYRVLEALKKVGTSHAIPFVERVEQRGRTIRLRDTAADVLVVLRERQRQENQRDTLLRPAPSPDNPADILLRPARDIGETDPQLLLRPSSLEE